MSTQKCVRLAAKSLYLGMVVSTLIWHSRKGGGDAGQGNNVESGGLILLCRKNVTIWLESVLRDQFTWMRVFLERTNTIEDEEKQKIEEVLDMLGLEQLWDESPLVQAERARAEAKGFAKGEAKGSLETSRSLVETLVNVRFPKLTNPAHQKVALMTRLEDLRILLAQIAVAPNEAAAREFLLPQRPS